MPAFCCYKCGKPVPLGSGEKIRLRDTCPKCDADLHCCQNCDFFDPHVHNQCRETQAEWVRYKEEANHCDYFRPLMSEKRAGAQGKASSSGDSARKKFDDLFK